MIKYAELFTNSVSPEREYLLGESNYCRTDCSELWKIVLNCAHLPNVEGNKLELQRIYFPLRLCLLVVNLIYGREIGFVVVTDGFSLAIIARDFLLPP